MDYIPGVFTSKLHIVEVGVNRQFKYCMNKAYQYIMIVNPENMKVSRDNTAQWIQTEWKEVMVEIIRKIWYIIEIDVQFVAIIYNELSDLFTTFF